MEGYAEVMQPVDLKQVPADKFWAIMQAIEDYMQAQEDLAAALKAGLFDVAKAKYSLGPGSLGQQCHPGDMQATATVQLQLPETQPDSLYDTFQLCQQLQQCSIKAPVEHKQQQQEAQAAVAAEEPGLRHRKQQESQQQEQQNDSQQQPDGESNKSQPKSSSSSGSSEDHSRAQADPVAWFSALPPAALRSAQSNFQTVLQRAVAAANRAQQLRQLLENLQDSHGAARGEGTESAE